jgi:Zn-dependent protease
MPNISSEQMQQYLITIAIFLVSLSIHEFAHAWTAFKFGDMTAKSLGRLTLNPIAHISPFGTILMPILIGFGWAKPVPVDFSVLSKRQVFLVAVAGPLSNIILALALTVLFHIPQIRLIPYARYLILMTIQFNFILAAFNLIPIPPLDGSRMVYAWLKSPAAINIYNQVSQFGFFIILGFIWYGGFDKTIGPIVSSVFSLLRLH